MSYKQAVMLSEAKHLQPLAGDSSPAARNDTKKGNEEMTMSAIEDIRKHPVSWSRLRHYHRSPAHFYENFVNELLKSGVCVGWHWFKYMDNDPTDLTTDPSNRNSNKGIVAWNFARYDPLLRRVREMNGHIYALASARALGAMTKSTNPLP